MTGQFPPDQPMEPTALPLSAMIMTYNEEKNILHCLQSIADWVPDIIIVDSYSTDSTERYTRQFTDRVYRHEYVSAPAQWAWALRNVPIQYEWLLMLDADFQITPQLREAIINAVQANNPLVNAYMVSRLQIFRGTPLRHGGLYPRWEVRLVRHKLAQVDETQGVDHRLYCPGLVKRLQGDLIEHNRNEDKIAFWLQKHFAYANRHARQELEWRRGVRTSQTPRLLGTPEQRKLWFREVWYRLPLYLRPLSYFVYRYVLRGGFLDGKQGFVFNFLQAYW
jgi:glycosyltransferase involved in cell wall biosynthesis